MSIWPIPLKGCFHDSLLNNVQAGPRSEATMFLQLRFPVNSGLPERRFA